MCPWHLQTLAYPHQTKTLWKLAPYLIFWAHSWNQSHYQPAFKPQHSLRGQLFRRHLESARGCQVGQHPSIFFPLPSLSSTLLPAPWSVPCLHPQVHQVHSPQTLPLHSFTHQAHNHCSAMEMWSPSLCSNPRVKDFTVSPLILVMPSDLTGCMYLIVLTSPI